MTQIGVQDISTEACLPFPTILWTDGAEPYYHFLAGKAYFDMREWSRCERFFKLVTEMDDSRWDAAYNAGLCLEYQGYSVDAQQYFKIALRRNPPSDVRAKIQEMLPD